MKILTLDTETTGLCLWDKESSDPGQPRVCEIAAVLDDHEGKNRHVFNAIIKPEGYTIPVESSNIHGITHEMAMDLGLSAATVFRTLMDMMEAADGMVCHNIGFDFKMLKIEAHHLNLPQLRTLAENIPHHCTMTPSTNLCKIPKASGHGYKWPTLGETTKFLFNEDIANAHSALVDTKACRRIYYELVRREIPTLRPKKLAA
jgi:DNA polymerase III epsilon subunit-like protein